MPIRPFTYTTQGLPLCLVPSTHIQGWNVLLCGVQLAEAVLRDNTAYVSPWSPRDTDTDHLPDVVDSIIFGTDGADPSATMRKALDEFASNFLAAAEAEQLRIETRGEA